MITMNLHIVNFKNLEDVINYIYNAETLKLSLTFTGPKDSHLRVYLKCDTDDWGQVFRLGTKLLYCEGKTNDAPNPCHLAGFEALLVYGDIVNFSKVGKVKSQFLFSFTFRRQVRGQELTAMFTCNNRAFTNLQHRNVKLKIFKSIQVEFRDMKRRNYTVCSPKYCNIKFAFSLKILQFFEKRSFFRICSRGDKQNQSLLFEWCHQIISTQKVYKKDHKVYLVFVQLLC